MLVLLIKNIYGMIIIFFIKITKVEIAQQADSPDRISPGIIATTPARKIPGDTRPVILVVGQIQMTRQS